MHGQFPVYRTFDGSNVMKNMYQFSVTMDPILGIGVNIDYFSVCTLIVGVGHVFDGYNIIHSLFFVSF